MKSIFLFIVLCIASTMAFAQITLPEDVSATIDWALLFQEIVANPKSLLSASGGALLVYLAVQFLKTDLAEKWFKKLTDKKQFALITILGQVFSLLITVFVPGTSETGGIIVALSTFLTGILSSGGGVAIFNAIKLLFGKETKGIVINAVKR